MAWDVAVHVQGVTHRSDLWTTRMGIGVLSVPVSDVSVRFNNRGKLRYQTVVHYRIFSQFPSVSQSRVDRCPNIITPAGVNPY